MWLHATSFLAMLANFTLQTGQEIAVQTEADILSYTHPFLGVYRRLFRDATETVTHEGHYFHFPNSTMFFTPKGGPVRLQDELGSYWAARHVCDVQRQYNRHLYKGTLIQDCARCTRNDSMVWLLRGGPAVHACVPKLDFPRIELGRFYAAHFVCESQDCMRSFIYAKYRTDDINCFVNEKLPFSLHQEVMADPCLDPEAFIRRVSQNALTNLNPLIFWRTFFQYLTGEESTQDIYD